MDSDHVDLRPTRQGTSRFRPIDAISFAGDPEDTLSHLASALAQALDVGIAYVALREEHRLVLSGHLDQTREAPEWREMPLERSVCAEAMAVGEAVLIDDLTSNATDAPSAEFELLGAVSFAAFPLVLPNGEVIGALCAARITSGTWAQRDRSVLLHLAAAATLVLRHRSAIRAAAALTDAVGRMDGPLQALTDQVRRLTTLISEHEDPRVRTAAALADGRVREVDELMRVARATARPALGQPVAGRVPAELVELTRRSVASAARLSGADVFRFDDATPAVTVRCDPPVLEHSLTNLLLTMAPYTGGTADIQLRVKEREEAVYLDVIDLGLGVPAAELVRMLHRFEYRGSSSSGTVQLVAGVVFADRGVIRARSSTRGTAFRIPFPRA